MQKKHANFNRSCTKKVSLGQKEKKRLIQLGLCICLLLIILASRSSTLFEETLAREIFLQIVQEDTDFAAAFADLGQSISDGDIMRSGIKTFFNDLFGAKYIREPEPKRIEVAEGAAFEQAVRGLSSQVTLTTMLKSLGVESADVSYTSDLFSEDERTENDLIAEGSVLPSDGVVPREETVIYPVYDGPELPVNVSMEYVALGLSLTVTPVSGEISSGFGYRDHPLTAEHSFHSGVDIAAESGTPIAAFADGIVEFIGESDAYGLYIQLDHGNGVKTFYCHCSELLYGKGTPIVAGQTIAMVGDTGDVTGPHLHLELKKDGVLLNPSHYIEVVC